MLENGREKEKGINMIKTIKTLYFETKLYDKKFLLYVFWSIVVDILKLWINVSIIGLLIYSLELNDIKKVVLVVIFFAVTNFLLSIIANYMSIKINIIGERMDGYFNVAVFQNMLKMEYEKQEREETKRQYEFANTAINEIGIVKLTRQIMAIIESIINVVIASVALSFLNILLILAVLIIAGVNVFSEIYRMRCRYEVNQQTSTLEWNMYYVRDYLSTNSFAKEIRVFGMRDYVLNKLKYFIDRYTSIFIVSEKKYLKKYGFVYVLDGILLAIIYFYGIFLFITGNVETGIIAVYFSSMTTMVVAILNVVKNVTEITESSQYMIALQNFLKMGENEQRIALKNQGDVQICEKSLVIEFDNVSFRYPGAERDTLKNISFRIESGEKIAIVGKNGAGKTTLIHLLLRLYKPTEGRILINGFDYLSFSEETIYKLFSVVLQDFGIYPFSVFSNICMGEKANVNRVRECIEMVGLKEKIASLNYQEDTFLSQILDEEGVEFSGGESQRLAMARALYKDSPVLVLDEPTAALSPRNEYDLYAKFKEISKEKTTIFISHKLAMCRLCDRIIVLDDGIIEEIDSHDKLMKTNNIYSKMFQMQAESFNL